MFEIYHLHNLRYVIFKCAMDAYPGATKIISKIPQAFEYLTLIFTGGRQHTTLYNSTPRHAAR